jgi:hypothetical protein
MLKQVILFNDGTFWKCYQHTTKNINEAWTFNKVSGAANTVLTNGLTDCTIVPVTLTFSPFSVTRTEE